MVQEATGYVLNGFAPESYSISASVLQGGTLGTLLFIIMIYKPGWFIFFTCYSTRLNTGNAS